MTNTLEDISEIATEMLKILDDPKRWIKGAMARDENNEDCSVQNPKACGFCFFGAAKLACIRLHRHVLDTEDFMAFAARKLGTSNVDWNDHPDRTYSDIITWLKYLQGLKSTPERVSFSVLEGQ